MAELDEWAAAHLAFLETIWREFAVDASWPEAPKLTRRLFGTGVRMDLEQTGRDMPPALGRFDPQHQQLMLTVRGLAYLADARSLCDQFVLVLAEAVRRYGTPDEEAVVSSQEFVDLLAIEPADARRLEELCRMESWALLAQGGELGTMRFGLSEAVIFEVADASTLENYLEAQADAWWPDLDGTTIGRWQPAQSSSNASLADLQRPERAAYVTDHLHPLIASAAAELLAGDHRREAVERAGVALQDAVRERAGLPDADGEHLMNLAFTPKRPRLSVGDLETASGANVQRGVHLLAQGIIAAIRNPTAHRLVDPGPAETMEQLAILSFVARRLEHATLIVEQDG
ncbi:MAG TPA: TIGR02391 family protein [Baekduia sp.]|uniref:TIGR02391 family protein n=1 Tax=Baekduia sp. TaxID=2600305 RepID=UPI002D06A3DF|nr:TIGR02391 family protein [Baekduia sp.]HMJ33163.1 TIGR02391 family protein [Baekduia sp.]